MSTITLEQAHAELPSLIAQLAPGEELVILQGAEPVAKLLRPPVAKPQPVFGRGRGKIVVVSDDEEHLEAFKDYMP